LYIDGNEDYRGRPETFAKLTADDSTPVAAVRAEQYRPLNGAFDPSSKRSPQNLVEEHGRNSFAFVPHLREPIDGDITYSDTSVSIDWLTREFPEWKIETFDCSPKAPYQRRVFFAPRMMGGCKGRREIFRKTSIAQCQRSLILDDLRSGPHARHEVVIMNTQSAAAASDAPTGEDARATTFFGRVKRSLVWLRLRNNDEDKKKGAKADGNLPGLYGLRAVAALMIVFFHLAPNVRVPDAFSVIKTHFGEGVPLFFVLSGFSLMYSTSGYVGRDGWVQIYFIKRFFRIAPLFYAMIAFFTVYNILVWQLQPTLAPIIIDALFLHNLVPGYHESLVWAGWTLGVEMLFYALFPILLIVITNFRRGLLLLLLSVLASNAARDLFALKGQGAYASMSLVVNSPYFAAGIGAFFLFKALAAYKWKRFAVGVACTLALAAILLPLVFNPAVDAFVHANRLDIVIWGCLFGLVCVWQSLYPSKILASLPLQFCGERSYSLYLVHAVTVFRLTPLYTWVYGAVGNDVIAFLISVTLGVGAAIFVASLAFRWIEMPGIRWGASIIEKSRRGAREAAPRTLPAA
jgi:peptidoglycan/LPS O-acetylase OafA/YrhL